MMYVGAVPKECCHAKRSELKYLYIYDIDVMFYFVKHTLCNTTFLTYETTPDEYKLTIMFL